MQHQGIRAIPKTLDLPTEALDSKSRTYRCWVNLYHKVFTDKQKPMLGNPEHELKWKLYENFVTDMGVAPSNEHSLTRKDRRLGYTKENTVWQIKNTEKKPKDTKTKNSNRKESGKFLSTIGATSGDYASKHELYRTWYNLLSRCFDESNKSYKEYKDRQPPKEWLNFEAFVSEVGERPNRFLSLDRKDNEKPYSKENVRWATRKEQADNRKTGVKIVYQGVDYSLESLSKLSGVAYETLNYRRKQGWPIEELVKLTPSEEFLKTRKEYGKSRQKDIQGIFVELYGKRLTLKDWAKTLGVNYSTLKSRISRGQDGKKVLLELEKTSKTYKARDLA